MIFVRFSYDFLTIFLRFSYDVLMIFVRFSYDFLTKMRLFEPHFLINFILKKTCTVRKSDHVTRKHKTKIVRK